MRRVVDPYDEKKTRRMGTYPDYASRRADCGGDGTAMLILKECLPENQKDVCGVTSQATLDEVLRLMAEKEIGAVPVLDGGTVVGIFSESDLARIAFGGKPISVKESIQKFMTKKVLFVHPGASMEECMVLMSKHRIRYLPVLDNGRISGMITIDDVVRHTLQEQQNILKRVLDTIEEGKSALRANITFNVEHNILPLVRQLAQKHANDEDAFRRLENRLNDIVSEQYRKLISVKFNFTPAEISVIRLIKANYREKEIAQALNISLSTVKKHKYAIRGKLGVRNTSGNILKHLEDME